ncbi:hypothetical protein BKA61DRAFT_333813 [Leptodontidium sp. MPI-SDFR-AT-0119]|nr:hypothetical protein BKA61DRAFT_333813 [Leptodontidium sp. MPI-SDFR-AT-0119]
MLVSCIFLSDLLAYCSGIPPGWSRCPQTPRRAERKWSSLNTHLPGANLGHRISTPVVYFVWPPTELCPKVVVPCAESDNEGRVSFLGKSALSSKIYFLITDQQGNTRD